VHLVLFYYKNWVRSFLCFKEI